MKYDAKNLVEGKSKALGTLITTLITCLPNESKEILHNNGIVISTSTSKPPMFNYASFCKSLSNYKVYCGIFSFLKDQKPISAQVRDNKICIVEQEIYKLFMNQISSLKYLSLSSYEKGNNVNALIICLKAKDCLKNLSELSS